MRTAFGLSAAVATALVSTSAMAQSGEAIIYNYVGYSGAAVNVSREQSDLGLNWPVRSILVKSGVWQVCSRTKFRAPCYTVSESSPNLMSTLGFNGQIQSMRPIRSAVKPTPPSGGGYSLRGMAAEFFPAPRQGRERVVACPRGSATAQCAAESADRFCKSVGWTGARSEAMQSEGRRVYLADVLCARAFVN